MGDPDQGPCRCGSEVLADRARAGTPNPEMTRHTHDNDSLLDIKVGMPTRDGAVIRNSDGVLVRPRPPQAVAPHYKLWSFPAAVVSDIEDYITAAGDCPTNPFVEQSLVQRLSRPPPASEPEWITLDMSLHAREYTTLDDMIARLGDLGALTVISMAKEDWNRVRRHCVQLPRKIPARQRSSPSSSHHLARAASFMEILMSIERHWPILLPVMDSDILLEDGNCGPLAFANAGWIPHDYVAWSLRQTPPASHRAATHEPWRTARSICELLGVRVVPYDDCPFSTEDGTMVLSIDSPTSDVGHMVSCDLRGDSVFICNGARRTETSRSAFHRMIASVFAINISLQFCVQRTRRSTETHTMGGGKSCGN